MDWSFFQKEKGLTLVELLMALVVSSILMAALYRTFLSQQRTYTVQEQVVDMQQNVRAASDQMIREIRMAGYRRDILASLGNINGFTRVITPGNNANSIGNHDDQITVIIKDKAITFKLQPDERDPTIPVLIRDDHKPTEPQERPPVMAENVENLQFRYVLSDGTLTDSPANPDLIREVQMTITARTRTPDPQLSGDGYLRRKLSSVIKVRNLGL